MVYSNPDNITSFFGTLVYVDDATGNMFAPLIVLVIFLVGFISSKNYDSPRAIMIASLLAFMSATGFFFLGFLDMKIAILTAIATIFSLLYSLKAR